MNVYSELLDLLCPRQAAPQTVHFGTICGVSLIALIALLVVNAKRKNA